MIILSLSLAATSSQSLNPQDRAQSYTGLWSNPAGLFTQPHNTAGLLTVAPHWWGTGRWLM